MKKFALIVSIFGLSTMTFAQLDRSKAPQAQPNPEIKIEIPEAMEFANGLKVIMVENHKLPVVSFQLFVDYPAPVETDKAGLSTIFGELLDAGTKETPKDEFDETIDYIGATLSTSRRGFYASSLKKHTPQLLGLISQMITAPAFTQADFDRIVDQNRSGLASLPSSASAISSNVTNVVNYGTDHPYGEVMTEKTLDNITLDDVKAFYKENFIPNHAYLVVVGDVNRDDVKSYVENYFMQWKKSESLTTVQHDYPDASGRQVYFVDKPGAVQSVIKVTHNLDLPPGHEDAIAINLMNSILGGGSFSARLMANLREDKAYTYGCYSDVSSDPLVGSFSAGGSFRNEVTDSAIVQILDEIKRITNEEVTDKELDLVKKSTTGAFARSLESPQTIASFALNTVRYNLPKDYYATYLRRLENVSKEDVLMAAEKYLTPDNLNIVVVGNENIADKLKALDSDGQIEFRNYYGNKVEKLKQPAAGITAETVLNNYLMKMLMVNSKAEMQDKLDNLGQIEVFSHAYMKEYNTTLMAYNATGKPNKSATYIMVKSPMGNQVAQEEWFNGTEGMQVQMGAEKPYEGEGLEEKKKASFPANQMYYLTDDSKTVELMGIADLDGVEHYKLKIGNKEDENDFSYEFYHVESGLLTRKESFTTDENDEVISVNITYADYKDFNGLFMAGSTEINTQGQVLKFDVKQLLVGKKAKSKSFNGNFKKAGKLLKKS